MAVSERDRVRDLLTYSTPFWAGGITKGPDGWRYPGPKSFKGVAKIVNKDRELVPLVASPWQLEFDEKLEEQRAKGLPMRAIVLKARQLGFSTWTEAKIAQRVTQLPYQNAVVVAHEIEAAGMIFEMALRMYSHLPTEEELGLGFNIKPALIGKSFTPNGRKFMAFGERSGALRIQGRDQGSILSIDTANAPESGRGQTRNLVHLSEVAKWPERATSGTTSKMVSVLNSVPYRPETLVVLESTANGLNHFYRRWLNARDGAEDPETGETYVPIFVPWWRDQSNAMAFATPESRERFVESIGTGEYGEEEPALVEVHGCTPEQLFWRRMQIRTQHENSVELFKQENPATDEEAFIGSGRTVFSGILVARAIGKAEQAPEPVRGTLRAVAEEERRTRGGTIMVPRRVVWVPEEKAGRGEPLLSVWEHPVTADSQEDLPESERRPEGAYIVAADIAEGIANTFAAGDFHAVQIFDHRSRRQVAVYESRIDMHLMARWLVLIATYYNRAWLGIERNGPGVAVVEAVGKDFRYARTFRHRPVATQHDPETGKLGWVTDRVSKPVLENVFGETLQEGTHGLQHVPTARQLNTYVIDDRGKHGAQEGEHDDLLMAAMIAHRLMDVMKPPKAERRQRRNQRPYDPLTGW